MTALATVSASLRASAAAFRKLDRAFDAIFTGELADQCERMGTVGDALFAKWARDQEARVQSFNRAPPPVESAGDARQLGVK